MWSAQSEAHKAVLAAVLSAQVFANCYLEAWLGRCKSSQRKSRWGGDGAAGRNCPKARYWIINNSCQVALPACRSWQSVVHRLVSSVLACRKVHSIFMGSAAVSGCSQVSSFTALLACRCAFCWFLRWDWLKQLCSLECALLKVADGRLKGMEKRMRSGVKYRIMCVWGFYSLYWANSTLDFAELVPSHSFEEEV